MRRRIRIMSAIFSPDHHKLPRSKWPAITSDDADMYTENGWLFVTLKSSTTDQRTRMYHPTLIELTPFPDDLIDEPKDQKGPNR